MKSKTKTLPTDAVLRDMLEQAGIDSAGVQFRLLGDGMFNAVFAAETNPPVVMKVAPRPQVPVMTYERDMLATELYWRLLCRIFCIVTRRAACAARPGW